MSDFCARDNREHAVDHAEACTQDRNECDFLSGEYFCRRLRNRSLDLLVGQWKIACYFICHKHGDLVNQFTEFLCRSILVTKHRDLVLDQRVIK